VKAFDQCSIGAAAAHAEQTVGKGGDGFQHGLKPSRDGRQEGRAGRLPCIS
jgi:hypothetical protein